MPFRTDHVQQVLSALENRIRNRLHRPGDRFATARQIANQYDVSYQTAHRLLADLAERGLIVRRPRSGSYIAGPTYKPTRIRLMLHPRAENPQGFGGKLRRVLLDAFEESGLPCDTTTTLPNKPDPGVLPIIWQMPEAVTQCVESGSPGILVNERPEPGWGSSLLDSVCADDYAGGALAADTLLQGAPGNATFAVLAGPKNDRRSNDRIAGFRSKVPGAKVTHADNWHRDAGRRAADAIDSPTLNGIFAANDRLAQGLLLAYKDRHKPPPRIVGYDDAPIAQQLGLTTIALPWTGIARAIVERAQTRLKADLSPARTLLLQPAIVFHGK